MTAVRRARANLVRRLTIIAAGLGPVLTPVAAMAQRATADAGPTAPRLVVFITVDQLTPTYFARYGDELTSGFGRLLRGGAVFINAFQDHANTETAPGHATTMSGRFPRSTGILLNTAGVPDPQAPLIGGGGPGASPFRFRGSTLIDWMRIADPRSRALSVSRKDRGAILPLGRAHQQVFWYAADGRFTTSTYYADTLPAWVKAFNARRVPQRSAGHAWTLLVPDSAYHEPDSVAVENAGRGSGFTFPHVLAPDSAGATRDFIEFPWMDQLTADLALDGVSALHLGEGPATDLLAVSFSTTDAVGHRFGTESREVHDQVVRLDRTLGAFIDSLYRLRDSSQIVVALTADHGVTPTPELWGAASGQHAYRVNLDSLEKVYQAALVRRGLPAAAFSFEDAVLSADRRAFAAAHVSLDSVVRAFARAARRVPGVRRADTPTALARMDTVHDAIARRWLHALPPDSRAVLVVTLDPHSVWGSYATGIHGGPYDADAHVPVIFYGPPFAPGRYTGFTRVADMAPTLAHVLGVTPAERLDGRVLREALRQP